MYSNGVRVVPSEVVYSCSAVHVLLYESTKIKVHNYEGTISTCTFVHVYFRTLYLRSTKVPKEYESTKVRKYNYFVRKYLESTFESTFVLSYVRLLQVHVRTTYTYVVRVHVLYTTRAGLVQGYHSDRRIRQTSEKRRAGACTKRVNKS